MTNLIRDFEGFLAVGPNEEEKTEELTKVWVDERVEANRILAEQVERIEAYVEGEKLKKAEQVQKIKQQRIAFFKERAQKMVPPLSPEALELLPKYILAIEIQKPPSERSWHELWPKLEADRSKAEELLRMDKELREGPANIYQEKVDSRKDDQTVEQMFVLELADKVIAEMGELVAAGSLAPVDFIPFVFRKLYDAYKNVPDEAKPVDSYGNPYRLLMEDARMVYRVKILPFIATWDDGKKRAAILLKCPGCKRKEGRRCDSFDDLLCHILDHHRSEVGTLSYFRSTDFRLKSIHSSTNNRLKYTYVIAWFSLAWPINLPILATHRAATGEWDPNDDSEPIQAPDIPENFSRNAFEGRYVVRGNYPPRCDFVKNLLHAATLLQGTTLAGQFKSQIVFKYAVDRHVGSGSESFVPVKSLKDLPVALLRANIRGFFERFRCHKCVYMNGRERCGKKFAAHAHTVGELTTHYLDSHEHSLWTKEMFHFPSGEALWDAMTKPGMEQAFKVFTSLFPEEGESPSIIPWCEVTIFDKAMSSPTALIAKDSNKPESNVVDMNGQESDEQSMGGQDMSAKNLDEPNSNVQDPNRQNSDGQNIGGQDSNAMDMDEPNPNVQGPNAQDLNAEDLDPNLNAQDPNAEDSDGQEMNVMDLDEPNLNVLNDNSQDLNANGLDEPNSNVQDDKAQDMNGQNLDEGDSMSVHDMDVPISMRGQDLDEGDSMSVHDLDEPISMNGKDLDEGHSMSVYDMDVPISMRGQDLNEGSSMSVHDMDVPISMRGQGLDEGDSMSVHGLDEAISMNGKGLNEGDSMSVNDMDVPISMRGQDLNEGDSMSVHDLDEHNSNVQDPNAQYMSGQELDVPNSMSGQHLDEPMSMNVPGLDEQKSNVQDPNAQHMGGQDLEEPDSSLHDPNALGLGVRDLGEPISMNAPDLDAQNSNVQDPNAQGVSGQDLEGPKSNVQDPNAHDMSRQGLDEPNLNVQHPGAQASTSQDTNGQNIDPKDLRGQESNKMNLDDCNLVSEETNLANGLDPQNASGEHLHTRDCNTRGLVTEYLGAMDEDMQHQSAQREVPVVDEDLSQSRWRCVGWNPESLWGCPPIDILP